MSSNSRHSSAFERQNATGNFFGIDTAAAGGDGSVVIAGEALVVERSGYLAATAVKINANGKTVWTWQVKLKRFLVPPLRLLPNSYGRTE